jgi:hypothetical protein
MSDIDVTFRNENNGKEVEVTVSDDMPADAILRNLAEAGLIPNTPGHCSGLPRDAVEAQSNT